MGSCQTTKLIENKPNAKTRPDKPVNSQPKEKKINLDMPEWAGDRYTGVGIRKMKGYKCNLPIDELNILRQRFWNGKYQQDTIWNSIMHACYIDEGQARKMLSDFGLSPVEGCINHLRTMLGKHYFIPNYCINDPYFEKRLNAEVEVDETSIEIVLFEGTKEINVPITVSTKITGKELKSIYTVQQSKRLSSPVNLRLFFSGTEIKDEHCLYQHKLQNKFKIQVMEVPK